MIVYDNEWIDKFVQEFGIILDNNVIPSECPLACMYFSPFAYLVSCCHFLQLGHHEHQSLRCLRHRPSTCTMYSSQVAGGEARMLGRDPACKYRFCEWAPPRSNLQSALQWERLRWMYGRQRENKTKNHCSTIIIWCKSVGRWYVACHVLYLQ